MAVYNSMGALPVRRPVTLNKRKLPATASRTAVVARLPARPISSNTGLPGALAPPPPKTLNLRKRPAPAPVLNKRAAPSAPRPAPAPAPAPSSVIASDHGRYDGGGELETFVPAPSSGGGAFVPASDVEIVPPGGDAASKDGIPSWAAFAGIAACVVVGAIVLHQRGVI